MRRQSSAAAAARAGVTAALLAAGCVSAFPRPGTAEVAALHGTDPGARLEDLERGRSLYLSKCGGCHLLIEPAKHAPDAWPAKVQRMQSEGKVHLAAGELRDIERYLAGVSAVSRR